MTSSQGFATILIIDDELLNRKLLEALMTLQGYATCTAANAEDALESIQKNRPDLILLDIMMPGTDGYHFAEIIKSNPALAMIPIIMVTALTDRSSRLVGIMAGADDVLTKPVDRSELGLKIRNLLRLRELEVLQQEQGQVAQNYLRESTSKKLIKVSEIT